MAALFDRLVEAMDFPIRLDLPWEPAAARLRQHRAAAIGRPRALRVRHGGRACQVGGLDELRELAKDGPRHRRLEAGEQRRHLP